MSCQSAWTAVGFAFMALLNMMFNWKSNATFINRTFTRENIRAMHETMVRLYEAAKTLKGLETPTDVARALNQSQQTVNNWERRGISQGGMLKAQAEIGCSATWLQTGIPPMEAVKQKSGSSQIEEKLNESSGAPAYNVSRLPDPNIPVGSSPARPVYVVGRANGGLPERIWTDGGYLVGATEEYAVLATDDPHAFLTPIIGTSMAPVYNPGDFAFVEPGTEVDLGDDVLVRLKTGETLLKRLLVRRADGLQLGSYGEPGTLFFKPDEITWMYYVAHPVRRKKIKTRF
ncbi:helix-turn-helix transcriptional regulator [Cupriavidus sp. SHE]|jgi:phage repressor protein C with HTH and peptisase S24 domain|nr:helix-turn-helix transcriptional regulator [Cupriavidus sp. SHE]